MQDSPPGNPPASDVTGREATGWAMRTRVDDLGRTLFSVYVGPELAVEDVPSPDAAVAAARRWLHELRGRAGPPRGGVG